MVLAIAGERSGVGKTTITLAILSYLAEKKEAVQSFKVGPDYIDPMFHREVTGRSCRNLDPILTSQEYVRHCFAYRCQNASYALIEGVMGLFDGVGDGAQGQDLTGSLLPNDYASTAHVARLLDVPVLLVIDCSRLSGSAAAIARGYSTLDARVKIAGLLLNRVGSDRHRSLLLEALEPLQIPILGIFPRIAEISLRDRHLGLIPTAELSNFPEIRDRLAALARDCLDWGRLLPLLKVPKRSAPPEPFPGAREALRTAPTVRIGVARDRAFNFYYQDNLDLLEHWGAELIPWSPMEDSHLPENLQGFYFGGGFPEVFASELAENWPMKTAVRSALQGEMLAYAECGGLMYLSEKLVDLEGCSRSMVGAIPTTASMTPTLTLGYRQATVLQPGPLLQPGEVVWGHEFHRSQLAAAPTAPLFSLRGTNGTESLEGWTFQRIHASYLHLHWGAHPQIAGRFVRRACGLERITRKPNLII